MFDVSESTLPLVGVERERVVAAALLAPEGLVEALPQLVGLRLEPLGQLALAPHVARQLGQPPLRVVDVALHLAGSDRRLGQPAVVEELRVAGVLPGLVDEAALRTGAGTRRSRRRRGRRARRSRQAPAGPARAAPGRSAASSVQRQTSERRIEVEGRRVDRPVVAREPGVGALPLPHLVDDLARLGVDRRVVLGRLQVGEGP